MSPLIQSTDIYLKPTSNYRDSVDPENTQEPNQTMILKLTMLKLNKVTRNYDKNFKGNEKDEEREKKRL